MGVFGSGNFENDAACDYINSEVIAPLSEILRRVIQNPTFADPDEDEGFQAVAAAEILALLCEKYPATPPPLGLVIECRRICVERWVAGIENLNPKPGHKEARKVVIEETFSRLLDVVRRFESR